MSKDLSFHSESRDLTAPLAVPSLAWIAVCSTGSTISSSLYDVKKERTFLHDAYIPGTVLKERKK